MSYKINGPSYAFCGTFSGKDSASRWLRKLEHELSGYRQADGLIPPDKYMDAFNMLFTDDAGDWADSNPDAIRLLNTEEPTKATVDTFKALLCERFPSKAAELTPVPFDVELAELRQKSDESLVNYYKRVLNLVNRFGGRDRPSTSSLSSWESAMLDTVLRAFLRGIIDLDVRREATKGMGSPERSLRSIYTLAEEARRTNLDIQKMLEEEVKSDELAFYKELVHRNLSKHEIETRLMTYHATKAKVPSGPLRTSWSIYEDKPADDHPPVPPAYESTVLAQNPNRANGAGPVRPPRRQNYQPTPRTIPERTTSKNPFINGSKPWTIEKDGRLCIKCGHLGHLPKECNDEVLPAWEQSYLREIVFGTSPQVNFAAAGYGDFDGRVYPFGTSTSSASTTPATRTPQTSTTSSPMMSGALATSASSSSNAITIGCAGLSKHPISLPKQAGPEGLSGLQISDLTEANVNAIDANYGEGSGPNKRPHVEQSLPQQDPSQPPLFQFQSNDRTKAKGQKRVGKKAEPQPLVGIFNDSLGKYNPPISIRHVLQTNKIDMTWMDLVAWSPAVCKELKRLCTRVSKKKAKGKKPEVQQPNPNPFSQFNPQFNPSLPQQAPQMPQQMPPQPQQMPQLNIPPQVPLQQTPQTQIPQFFQPQPAPQPPAAQAIVSSTFVSDDEKHTRFISNMLGVDKAFRVPCVIVTPDGSTVPLDKRYVQADQGSDMNVLSTGLAKKLNLTLRPLSEVGFQGLSMRTADHRETLLHHWAWVRLAVEGIVRDIRCFVAPEVTSITPAGETEYLSLILGLPWLFAVDAIISIRQSAIMVGDASLGETRRTVVGPELVFCKDHNLLMYPKSALATPSRVVEVESQDSSDSSDDDGDDELSDVEDPKGFQ